MTKKPQIDPLRAQLLDTIDKLSDRTTQLRDYGTTPGNAWLAKNELQAIAVILGDLETLLEDIKNDDAENGY